MSDGTLTQTEQPVDSSGMALDAAMQKAFDANYIDATDLFGKGQVRVKIAAVAPPDTVLDAQRKPIRHAVLSFVGKKKRFICNTTNARIIGMHYGQKASAWIGQEIQLEARYLARAFGQENVPVVRVVPPPDKKLTFSMRKNVGQLTPYTPEELAKDKRRSRGDD